LTNLSSMGEKKKEEKEGKRKGREREKDLEFQQGSTRIPPQWGSGLGSPLVQEEGKKGKKKKKGGEGGKRMGTTKPSSYCSAGAK